MSEDKAEIARLEIMRAGMFSGPLPPPELLRQYEEILPGLPERIVSSWEAESQHRRSLENRAAGISERGQWIAAALAVLFLGVSGLLIYFGQSAAGVALLVAEIVGLVAVFVYDRRESRLASETVEEDSQPPPA